MVRFSNASSEQKSIFPAQIGAQLSYIRANETPECADKPVVFHP
jgi:hypothetical protein